MNPRLPQAPSLQPGLRARAARIGAAVAIPALLLLVAGASAHPEAYPNLSNLYPGVPGPTPYYTKFDAGHVVPDATGSATLMIVDIWTPVGGLICQDLNEDQVCGDEAEFELAIVFCGSVTIQDVNHGGGWDPKFDLYVFPASPVILYATCGTFNLIAALGNVHHT